MAPVLNRGGGLTRKNTAMRVFIVEWLDNGAFCGVFNSIDAICKSFNIAVEAVKTYGDGYIFAAGSVEYVVTVISMNTKFERYG